MAHFDFYTPSEVRKLGLKSFGRRVLIRKTVRLINPEAITLGDNVMIDDFVVMHAEQDVILLGNNHVAAHCELFGRFGLTMERYAGFASRVTVYTESDDYSGAAMTNPTIPERFKPGFQGRPVEIGQHAIVGSNSTLLPGAILETGVAVGAHSIVKGRLQEWGIYAGQPAKFLKERKQDLLQFARQYEAGE